MAQAHVTVTAQDDLLGHQAARPFASVPTDERRWSERFWYTAQSTTRSDVLIDIGLGYHPNCGVMDGFAGVSIGRRQFNFRASRQLGADPLRTEIGPLRISVVEGMREHRIVLEANDSPLQMDITFHASLPSCAEAPRLRRTRSGVLLEELQRLSQFGRYTGWVQVDGERFELDGTHWLGQRDRSWGIRPTFNTDVSLGTPDKVGSVFWTWSLFQLPDSGLCLYVQERSPGQVLFLSGAQVHADGSVRHLRSFGHDLVWADDPLGQTIEGGTLQLGFEEGLDLQVRLSAMGARFYLKGGLYGGFQGWNHGDDRGPLHCAHDVWDLDDAETRRAARTLGDHVARVEVDGAVGFGIMEYGVGEGFPLYAGPQRFPAF